MSLHRKPLDGGSSQGSGTTPSGTGDDSGSQSGGGSVTELSLGTYHKDTYGYYEFEHWDEASSQYVETAYEDPTYTPNEASIIQSSVDILQATAQSQSNVVTYAEPVPVWLGMDEYNHIYCLQYDEGDPRAYELNDEGEEVTKYDPDDEFCFSPTFRVDGTPKRDGMFIYYIAEFSNDHCYGLVDNHECLQLLVEDTQKHVGLFRLSKTGDGNTITKPLYFCGYTNHVIRSTV